MKRLPLLLAMAASPLILAVGAPDNSVDNSSNAAFARLKSLVGEWEAPMKGGGTAHASYELISGGTALVEHESATGVSPMLTVYYVDGDRLLLTHYCMVGNQPRMQANSFDPATGEIGFQFVDGTNMKSADDAHMHSAKIRLVDANHLSAEWQMYEGGQPKMTESFAYTRVK